MNSTRAPQAPGSPSPTTCAARKRSKENQPMTDTKLIEGRKPAPGRAHRRRLPTTASGAPGPFQSGGLSLGPDGAHADCPLCLRHLSVLECALHRQPEHHPIATKLPPLFRRTVPISDGNPGSRILACAAHHHLVYGPGRSSYSSGWGWDWPCFFRRIIHGVSILRIFILIPMILPAARRRADLALYVLSRRRARHLFMQAGSPARSGLGEIPLPVRSGYRLPYAGLRGCVGVDALHVPDDDRPAWPRYRASPYEAAEIDGASSWRVFWTVTLPGS